MMEKQTSIWGFLPRVGLLGTLSLAGVMTAVVVGSLDQPAQAARVTSWRFDPITNQLEILLNEGTIPRYFLLSQPSRIVIDLPNTDIGTAEIQRSYSGSVRLIRVAQLEEGNTRLVLELSPQVVLAPEQVQLVLPPGSDGSRWLLRPVIAKAIASSIAPASVSSRQLPPNRLATPQTSIVKVPPLNSPPSVMALANFPTPQAPMVKVPPLKPFQGSTPNTSALTTLTTLPPAIFPNQTSTVQVTRIQPATVGTSARVLQVNSVIDFGQPLPKMTAASLLPTRQSALSSGGSRVSNISTRLSEILLPVGSVMNLRYPGQKPLRLEAGTQRQEVLLLQQEVRDRTGKLVAPVGTPIIGRFETGNNGDRFITQAIILNGSNFPLVAQSNLLGNNRQSSQNGNVRNTSPSASQSLTIQPGEILPVQLTKDW